MNIADYGYVRIGSVAYFSKRPSSCARCAAICNSAFIKKVRRIVRCYDKEYYRIAPFFYGCAKAILEGSNCIKIDVDKGRFSSDRLRFLHDKVADMYSNFKRKERTENIIIGVLIFFAVLLAFVGVLFFTYQSNVLEGVKSDLVEKTSKIFYKKGAGFFCMGASVCCIALLIVMISLRVLGFFAEDALQTRLKAILDENCVAHFEALYAKLQFVREVDDMFLYKLVDCDKRVVKDIYLSTSRLCEF